jgi:hypothetical protein
VAAIAAQLGFYFTFLHTALRARDVALARPAMKRWIVVVLAWQLIVVAAAASYVALLGSKHAHGAAWVAPAIAAVIGTALPLQIVVVAVLRAGRPR